MSLIFEDFLESIEALPSEINHQLIQMRKLDKEYHDLKESLSQKHQTLLKMTKKAGKSDVYDTTIKAAEEQHQEALKVIEHKINLGAQTYESVDKHIRKLDGDLKKVMTILDKDIGQIPLTNSAAILTEQMSRRIATSSLMTASLKRRRGILNDPSVSLDGDATLSSLIRQDSIRDFSSLQDSESYVDAIADSALLEEAPIKRARSSASSLADMNVDPSEPVYCTCRQVSYGEMVACDNKNCTIEWFHYACVGLQAPPKGKWYCPDCTTIFQRRKFSQKYKS